MLENLQDMLRTVLLNNSFTYDSMDTTITNSWMRSYSYLYNLQKSYIGYEEHHYISDGIAIKDPTIIGNMYLDESNHVYFLVDYDFIDTMNREQYRLSRYYDNIISYEDMVYNPQIFSKIPVIMIDDHVIYDYKIDILKDVIKVILPFKRNFIIKNKRDEKGELIYIKHKIQVLIIDNIFYQRYTLNKSTTSFSTSKKTMTFDIDNLLKMSKDQITKDTKSELMKYWDVKDDASLTNDQLYEIDKETKRRIKVAEIPKKEGIMMASLHLPNSVGKSYELGTFLIPLVKNEDNNTYTANLTDDIMDLIWTYMRDFYVSFVFVKDLYQHTFYDNKQNTTASQQLRTSLFVIENEDGSTFDEPLPVEDFMVFKKNYNSTGYILVNNTKVLQLYYPNIYRIIDPDMHSGDAYMIYYFYHTAKDLRYENLFDFYFKFLKRVIPNKSTEEIINQVYYNEWAIPGYTDDLDKEFKDLFDKILRYQYHQYLYGETDYVNRYKKIPGYEDKEPIQYKVETLKEWILDDPEILHNYVFDDTKNRMTSFHLYTNTLDLRARLRNDTSPEFGDKTVTFDEPRYVFSFYNDNTYPLLLDCRIFVDGIFVCDVYQDRKLYMDYFYIPASMVTDDSFIELEIFPSYTFKSEVSFSSLNDTKEIKITEPDKCILPTMLDVYYEDENTLERFGNDDFITKMKYERGEFEYKTTNPDKPVLFSKIESISVTPKNTDVLNRTLNFSISKKTHTYRFMMDFDGYPYIELGNRLFNFDNEYIRVYYKGRLIPKSRYKFYNSFGSARILFLDWYDKGEIIYIDVTPYRYKEIYYNEDIESPELTLDLSNVISKPFDIRYYDVYMNGRRLSSNNVFAISPFQITLVNLKSNYNLTIYERDRDWEYFGLDYNTTKYYYTISDLLKSDLLNDTQKKETVKDIIDSKKDPNLNIYPNTNDEDPMEYDPGEITDDMWLNIFYYNELIPKNYVQPGVLQFNKEYINEAFKSVHDSFYVKPNEVDQPDILCLDPDKFIEAKKDSVVYTVGHLDEDLTEGYFYKQVIIPNDELE